MQEYDIPPRVVNEDSQESTDHTASSNVISKSRKYLTRKRLAAGALVAVTLVGAGEYNRLNSKVSSQASQLTALQSEVAAQKHQLQDEAQQGPAVAQREIADAQTAQLLLADYNNRLLFNANHPEQVSSINARVLLGTVDVIGKDGTFTPGVLHPILLTSPNAPGATFDGSYIAYQGVTADDKPMLEMMPFDTSSMKLRLDNPTVAQMSVNMYAEGHGGPGQIEYQLAGIDPQTNGELKNIDGTQFIIGQSLTMH
jgi:hypothetical protein